MLRRTFHRRYRRRSTTERDRIRHHMFRRLRRLLMERDRILRRTFRQLRCLLTEPGRTRRPTFHRWRRSTMEPGLILRRTSRRKPVEREVLGLSVNNVLRERRFRGLLSLSCARIRAGFPLCSCTSSGTQEYC